MKNTGTLRIQTFAARQSAPVEGVTVAVQGDGFTLHCITDATGSAADIPVEAPACALSLDEDNTTRPYAIVSLTAAKPGYRTVRIQGVQIFAGQVTLALPVQHCTPRVLEQVVIPKNITVHLGKPAASARNVTVSFRDYIANVASSEVYPTWVGQNKPTNRFKSRLCSKIPLYRHFLRSRQRFFRFYDDPVNEEYHKFPCQIGNLR